jgi:hypothetical protein
MQQARRPAFRVLANVLQLLPCLADPLIGLIAGFLGLLVLSKLYGTARPPPWLVGAVFGGVALLITWALRRIPEERGIIHTIVENVRRARSTG